MRRIKIQVINQLKQIEMASLKTRQDLKAIHNHDIMYHTAVVHQMIESKQLELKNLKDELSDPQYGSENELMCKRMLQNGHYRLNRLTQFKTYLLGAVVK